MNHTVLMIYALLCHVFAFMLYYKTVRRLAHYFTRANCSSIAPAEQGSVIVLTGIGGGMYLRSNPLDRLNTSGVNESLA